MPFVGGYAAVIRGNFFADAEIRGDFYSIKATNANLGLSNAGLDGNSITATGSTGYKFDVGRYFIEPSVGLIWSNLDLGSLATPTLGAPFFTPAGTLSFNAIESLIGRLGVRVGTTVQAGNIAFQPFGVASVWDEFAPNCRVNVYTDRIRLRVEHLDQPGRYFRTIRAGNGGANSQYRLVGLYAHGLPDRRRDSRLGLYWRDTIPIHLWGGSVPIAHEINRILYVGSISSRAFSEGPAHTLILCPMCAYASWSCAFQEPACSPVRFRPRDNPRHRFRPRKNINTQ